MTLTLRKPQIKEYNKVNQLIIDAFKTKNDPIQIDFFENPNIICLVALDDSEIVGTASLHIIQKSNRKMGLIEDVVTHPKHQGKGVGRQLVTELIKKAKKYGCYKTILNCTPENVFFYQKLGFSQEQLQMTVRQ
ncbi:MAG: GNAT family N-acetyltransferase [Flavobacteriaceae bacterium]|tara:strand:+ start:375 stop:776 length:402 start_codon:yes stop_codon:yes gene_type:complete